MAANFKFAESDGPGRNKKASWDRSISDRADCKREDRAMAASRNPADTKKADARAHNQKRVHQQDS